MPSYEPYDAAHVEEIFELHQEGEKLFYEDEGEWQCSTCLDQRRGLRIVVAEFILHRPKICINCLFDMARDGRINVVSRYQPEDAFDGTADLNGDGSASIGGLNFAWTN